MQNYTLFVELQEVQFTIHQIISDISASEVLQSQNKQFFVQAIDCVMSRAQVAAPLVITLRSIESINVDSTSSVMLTYVVVYSVPVPGDYSNYTLSEIINQYFFEYVYFITAATSGDAFMPVVNTLCTYATTKACYPKAHSNSRPKFDGPNTVTTQTTAVPTGSGQRLVSSGSSAVSQNSIIYSVVAVGGFMCLLFGLCYGISVILFRRKPGAPEDPSETLDAFASSATNRRSSAKSIRLDEEPEPATQSTLGRLSVGRLSTGRKSSGPGGMIPFHVPEDLFEDTPDRKSITAEEQSMTL